MSPRPKVYPLFSRFGVELEYMIVSSKSLNVSPIADRLMVSAVGKPEAETIFGSIAWNNELILHLIEFKTAEPATSLEGVDLLLDEEVKRAFDFLKAHDALLLPTGMHPWMNPKTESRLWPHEGKEIYQTFHDLFDCYRHGWANLQSVHLNLPFQDDKEFKELHAAIRFILPLIPALSASTPFAEGKKSGFHDYRMEVYRTNAVKVPRITGLVIPEPINSKDEYDEKILQPIYNDLAPIDKDETLQEEWVNARGAIARFERNTIEIRVIDTQEHPTADLAVLQAIVHLLKKLIGKNVADKMNAISTEDLSNLFRDIIKNGEKTKISLKPYLDIFGEKSSISAQDLWKKVVADLKLEPRFKERLDIILMEGTLATRLLHRFEKGEKLEELYRHLSMSLSHGKPFTLSSHNV
jgi:carboxylate-amine ligase